MIGRGPLKVTWTGTGKEPLSLAILFGRLANGGFLDDSGDERVEVRCLIEDDGEFTSPASPFQQTEGNGFVELRWSRQERLSVETGGRTILGVGSVDVSQTLALGDVCDEPEVAAACAKHYDLVLREYAECGETPPLRGRAPAGSWSSW